MLVSCLQPPNGGRIDSITSGDVGLRLAISKALDGFSPLMGFDGRPNLIPRAFAHCLPSVVRARISSRSNSARPPSTVSINRPCGVVVSAQKKINETSGKFLLPGSDIHNMHLEPLANLSRGN